MQENVNTFQTWVEESSRIVFFGGAGVSTESGIPDFRSEDGLYQQKYKYPPEMILSRSFFTTHTEDFYEFYREKMLCLDAKPNKTHKALAYLEQIGKLDAVITQNIDGLHQAAGSKKVLELHGSVLRNYCMKCGKPYDVADIKSGTGIPTCACGGTIKPDVVLYEEGLNDKTVSEAVQSIARADMLIVGGTSLSVYPAASLVQYYTGNRLVLINKTKTSYDHHANLVMYSGLGEVFQTILEDKNL